MTKTSPIEELIHMVGAIRRRIAPPNSARERMLRALYVPFLLRLERGARARIEPNPVCETFSGQAVLGATLPPAPRILILKLDHIGDFIVAMPAMEHLRERFPTAHMTLVCGSWSQDWAAQIGLFDDILVFDGMKRTGPIWTGFAPEHHAAFDALELGRFDLAVDLRHDPDTRPLLAKVAASHRAGFCAPAAQGGGSLDLALPDVEHVAIAEGTGRPLPAEQRLMLLASAVANGFARPRHLAQCLVSGAAPAITPRPYAIIAPGAGAAIREWKLDRLVAVGVFVQTHFDLDLVIIGTAPQREAADAFAQALPPGRVHNAIGVTLAQLPGLMQAARLYIGYDTGPTHLAAALGVPTVSVMSSIPDRDVWRILGDRVRVVRGSTACSPCHLMEVAQCPHNVVCLDVIGTQDVIAACQALLDAAPAVVAPAVAALIPAMRP